jgi:arginine repressor
MQAILAMLLKHPTSTNPELLAKLSNVGPEITASTLSTVRSDFLRSVRVLDQAGLLKSNPFAG